MSTRFRRPRSPEPPPGDYGDDDPTVIDGTPFLDEVTPVTMPRCAECGRVVFFDDFTVVASAISMNLFNADRCVRSKAGHWWWCGERWRLVYIPPR